MEWDKAMSVDGKISFHVTVAVFDQKLAASFDSCEKEIVGSKNHIIACKLFLQRFLFFLCSRLDVYILTCGFWLPLIRLGKFDTTGQLTLALFAMSLASG